MGARKLLLGLSLAAIVAGVSSPAMAAIYTASITNDQELAVVNPTTTTGQPRTSMGTATFDIADDGSRIVVSATVFGIDVTGSQSADTNDNLTAAHIHSGANFPKNTNGVVWGFFGSPQHNTVNQEPNFGLVPFPTGVGGTFNITWDLAEGSLGSNTLPTHLPFIREGLGRAYINFHTVQFGGGEIRGGIVPEPASLSLLAFAGLGLLRRRRRA